MESLYRYTLLGIALIIGFLLFLVIDASLALLFVKSIICFVRDADECVAELERNEVVFCTGSLYLCGDLLNAVKWTESCVC